MDLREAVEQPKLHKLPQPKQTLRIKKWPKRAHYCVIGSVDLVFYTPSIYTISAGDIDEDTYLPTIPEGREVYHTR